MIPKKIETKGIILGLDCSGESFSVAICQGEECLAQCGGFSPRSHLRRFFPALRDNLEVVGASFKDVEAVAVTVGPGSFTGLRLGVVTARTIAQVTGAKLLGINTLEALAMAYPGVKSLAVGLDARRGEIFGAFFDTSAGTSRRLTEDKAYKPEEFALAMQELNCTLAVGSGAGRYAESFPGTVVVPSASSQVRGDCVALLGFRDLREGKVIEPLALLPQYLRSAEIMVS
ncbi:tRNA (adenosine(37)-N6)-threonylcarbamoyltransferase complex dimerization subunit type 1 TsaB [bacterium]|nr:tRNA (adenosine(37)-N6)-threonylcarbamoyltransferase complex dimerization subunit type 1 TsaB [bacterium]